MAIYCMHSIPLAEISTVFLDAGNTLISMDYAWFAAELGALGFAASAESIRRAEAAARPAASLQISRRSAAGSHAHFELYLDELLRNLEPTAHLAAAARKAVAQSLAASLKRPGEDFRLWSRVLPGIPAALETLRSLGLDLVVVSNSDGSVERALEGLGLTAHLTAVLDSHVVGFEKPDPRFFRHALERTGAEAGRTVHVGDMYYQDIEGARAAGIHGVLLDPFGDWQVDDCARIRDLPELSVRFQDSRRPKDA